MREATQWREHVSDEFKEAERARRINRDTTRERERKLENEAEERIQGAS